MLYKWMDTRSGYSYVTLLD
ncbi:hypothetical protein NL108_006513, partial [Boleophthalmus pectinirostris]